MPRHQSGRDGSLSNSTLLILDILDNHLDRTMSTPSHRARKRKKPDTPFKRTATTQDVIATGEHGRSTGPGFPLVAFLWPARGSTSQWITLPLILILAGLFRWAVGLWGYSGYQKPPMHGDFEAQRHWMEITTHLPMSMWYFYDLPYWGLDYPPLTAYHSWICGKM
jgi:alpha-1,3-glucosyltransferase